MYGYAYTNSFRGSGGSSTPLPYQPLCSYYLNGTDGYLEGAGNISTLVGGSGKTWSVRIVFRRLTTGSAVDLLGSYDGAISDKSLGVFINTAGEVNVFFSSDGTTNTGNFKSSSVLVNDTDWRHMILTYDNGTFKCYIGSSLRAGTSTTIPTTLNTSVEPFKYGLFYTSGSPRYTKCYINQINWTSDVITGTEAATLFNGGLPLVGSDVLDNMALEYIFDNDTFDGTNWTLLDDVGANDGLSVNLDAVDKDCNENPY